MVWFNSALAATLATGGSQPAKKAAAVKKSDTPAAKKPATTSSPTENSKHAAVHAAILKGIVSSISQGKPAYNLQTSASAGFAGKYEKADMAQPDKSHGKAADAAFDEAKAATDDTNQAVSSAPLGEKKKLGLSPAQKLKAARTQKEKADTEVAAWEKAQHATEINYQEKCRAYIKAKVKAAHDPSYQKFEEKSAEEFAEAGEKYREARINLAEAKAKQKKLTEQYATHKAEVAAKFPRVTSIEVDENKKGNFTVVTAGGKKDYSVPVENIKKVGDYLFISTGKGQYDTYYNPESGKAPVVVKAEKVAGK